MKERVKKAIIIQSTEDKTKQEIEEERNRAIEKIKKKGITYIFKPKEEMWDELEDLHTCYPLSVLGDSLCKMSMCDLVYFCKDWKKSKHCRIVHEAAVQYGVGRTYE